MTAKPLSRRARAVKVTGETRIRLDPAHYVKIGLRREGRFEYQVFRGDEQLGRKLFSTACTVRSRTAVIEHAREELRRFIAREDKAS